MNVADGIEALLNAAPLAPITAAQVAVNGTIERAITKGTRRMSDEEQIGCAMAAGAISSVMYCRWI